MAGITHRKKKFIARNCERLSLEELVIATGLAPAAVRSIIEERRARSEAASERSGRGAAAVPASRFVIASAAMLIFICVIVLFIPALNNDFVWDDIIYIVENPWLRKLDSPSLTSMLLSFRAGNWHPLTWISHAVDAHFWGGNPAGHRSTNLVLHGCNAVLVFYLSLLLLARSGDGAGTAPWMKGRYPLIAAGTTALLFGLHPVHVESVVWVAERKDLLCTFFVLLSLMSYFTYTASSSRTRYVLALLFFVAALLSKPMAVTLPLILLLCDLYPLRRIRLPLSPAARLIPLLKEKIPFIAASAVSCVITIAAQKAGGALKDLDLFPLSIRLLNALRSPGFYLGKMLIPVELVPFYPYPPPHEWLRPSVVLSALTVVAVTLMSLRQLKRGRYLLFSAWWFYIITLLPVLGIVQVGEQAAADRYVYLPGMSVLLLAGIGAVRLIERSAIVMGRSASATLALLFLCVLITHGWLTLRQIEVWRDSETLWLHVTRTFPFPRSNPTAHNNLAAAYYQKGKWDMAIDEFKKAITLRPRYADAHNNLGAAYAAKGMFDDAIAAHQAALAINPNLIRAHLNLGVSYDKKGEPAKAIEEYKKVLARDADNATAHTYLAVAYYKQGNYRLAIEHCDRAMALQGSVNEVLLRLLAPYRNAAR